MKKINAHAFDYAFNPSSISPGRICARIARPEVGITLIYKQSGREELCPCGLPKETFRKCAHKANCCNSARCSCPKL